MSYHNNLTNAKKIAFEYLKYIRQSTDKKRALEFIARDIKKYDLNLQNEILSILIEYLQKLNKRLVAVYEHIEIRAQSNEDYIEYIRVLESLRGK